MQASITLYRHFLQFEKLFQENHVLQSETQFQKKNSF